MGDSIAHLLFLGIKGTVLALDRRTGGVVWETHLKSSAFVNVVLDGGDLLATTHGEIFCLDPGSGAVRWNNPLRGMGYGLVTIASGSQIAAMAEDEDRDAAASSSTPMTSTPTIGT